MNFLPRIAFFSAKSYEKEFFDFCNQKYQFRIDYIEQPLNETTVHLAKDAAVICIFVHDVASAPVLRLLHRGGAKLLALRSAGYDHVDLKAAQDLLTVVRVPEYSPYAVAEHAIGLMLSLNRKIHLAYQKTQKGNFLIDELIGFDMHGKTVGVIGTGHIGKAAVSILRGFGMRTLLYDPVRDATFAKQVGGEYVDLDFLYQTSDIISLHCALNADNIHMINAAAFKKMKQGILLINTARGRTY